MLAYIGRRILQIIPLLIALTWIIFFMIQLPPGDYLSMRIMQLKMQGTELAESEIGRLTRMYNLDKPLYQQYLIWIKGILLEGNLGRSMQNDRLVTEIIGDRLIMTITVSLITLAFIWAVAIPIGIYSATHQYSPFDYLFMFVGFLGISVPGFLVALIVLFVIFAKWGVALTGLFSPQFIDAPWSWARVLDLLKHIPVPMLIIGLSGTAGLIRTMRGMLLDELQKQYVITARAKGMSEMKLLFKYPVRLAINPMISTIGWLLPSIFSGEALVSIILNLPTLGPAILNAVLMQDMYMAGSILLLLSVLTIIGTLLSDILLAWLDPRIRFGGVMEEE